MDENSPITQAVRESGTQDQTFNSLSKDKLLSPTITSPTSPHDSMIKTPNSSLISRLLCCFRPSVAQSFSSSSSLNKNLISTEFTNKNFSNSKKKDCLLQPVEKNSSGKLCAVIDLDETLVHSSFQPVKNADFIIPVEIEGTNHQVYVLKRPHVDTFLQKVGQLFECVLFTASLGKYADPVTNLLDKWGVFQARLFREACVFHRGNYIKDLSRLGRPIDRTVIIDNSPMSYMFHPKNAIPVTSWFDDPSDTELLDLIPYFDKLSRATDIYHFLSTTPLPSGRMIQPQDPLYNQSQTTHHQVNHLSSTFSPDPQVISFTEVVVVNSKPSENPSKQITIATGQLEKKGQREGERIEEDNINSFTPHLPLHPPTYSDNLEQSKNNVKDKKDKMEEKGRKE